MKTMASGMAAALAVSSPYARAEPPRMPEWLTGCWEADGGALWAEECWSVARGGQMLGKGRSGDGKGADVRVRSWEFMRIEIDAVTGELAFHASPGGAAWTRFRAESDATGGLTFRNREHDYPQRVRYWREGEHLLAEVAQADGSRAKRWRFRRLGSE